VSDKFYMNVKNTSTQ